MNSIAQWLYDTQFSLVIRTHEWVVPTVQTLHIFALCTVLSSIVVTCLKALGVLGQDQSYQTLIRRFGPWFWWGLLVMGVTGGILIISEPTRELLSLSFWVKMLLLAVGVFIAAVFELRLRREYSSGKATPAIKPVTRTVVFLSLFIWMAVAVLGRFIASDELIWGNLPVKVFGAAAR